MQLQIQVWDVSQAETIIRFNRKCFLTDLWKPEDWRGLLTGPRARFRPLQPRHGYRSAGRKSVYL